VSVSNPKTLSRDFKHVKRHTPGGAPAFNGWVGLGIGLAIGLAVALAVHLKHTREDLPTGPEPATDAPPASAQAPTEVATPAAEPGSDLTFYDMLPKQEVEVPANAAGSNARSALPQGDVTLQAGSFKNVAEAEKLQAQLAQYGVDAKIQRFSLEDETWFRVRIGPIATVEELDTIRAKLAEAEVEATPVTAQPLTPLP